MTTTKPEQQPCAGSGELEYHTRECRKHRGAIAGCQCYPVLDSERITQPVGERHDDERKGLMLCCMRTAERYGDMQGGRGRHVNKIPEGAVINCAKCGQEIESLGGQAWKAK